MNQACFWSPLSHNSDPTVNMSRLVVLLVATIHRQWKQLLTVEQNMGVSDCTTRWLLQAGLRLMAPWLCVLVSVCSLCLYLYLYLSVAASPKPRTAIPPADTRPFKASFGGRRVDGLVLCDFTQLWKLRGCCQWRLAASKLGGAPLVAVSSSRRLTVGARTLLV